jgi:hypothetical protein
MFSGYRPSLAAGGAMTTGSSARYTRHLYNNTDRPVEVVIPSRSESIVIGPGAFIDADDVLMTSPQVTLLLKAGTLFDHQFHVEGPPAEPGEGEPIAVAPSAEDRRRPKSKGTKDA